MPAVLGSIDTNSDIVIGLHDISNTNIIIVVSAGNAIFNIKNGSGTNTITSAIVIICAPKGIIIHMGNSIAVAINTSNGIDTTNAWQC